MMSTSLDADLSQAEGLTEVRHGGPSRTILAGLPRSEGRSLPASFLAGCGVADWEIELAKLHDPSVPDELGQEITNTAFQLRFSGPIQISPLFISYSHADAEFVESLEPKLNKRGIRFWRDVHDATAGPLEDIVKRAMRSNPTVLLILSEDSVESDWVELEVESARRLAKELRRHVICPIALDDAWKECNWPERLRLQVEKYNILNFSGWRDESTFDSMFVRLVDGLKIFFGDH